MSIAAILEAQDEKSQSSFRKAVRISLAGHFVVMLVFVLLPEPDPKPLPSVIVARLVPLDFELQPEKIEVAPAAPVKNPVPRPAPAAPAPMPSPKKVVLPKNPSSIKRLKKLKKPPKPKELDYVDAIAALRAEMGESKPPPADSSPDEPAPVAAQEARAAPDSGFQVSPEVARWMIATERHIRKSWITPPEFLNRNLRTELRVELSAAGDVLGTPVIVGSSGDPFWDDNTIRALMRANPLPPPPESGIWPFIFAPE